MNVYISGPMTGLPDYNYPAFYAAEQRLRDNGHKVRNPAKIGPLSDYDMYWPINKAMMDGADAIYMLRGWEDSLGANREMEYAQEIGLTVMFERGGGNPIGRYP